MWSMAAAALWEGEQDDGLVLVRRWRFSARRELAPGRPILAHFLTETLQRLSLSYENMNPEGEMIIIREHEPG